MGPGDVISYPAAGTQIPHAFLADEGEQFEYLAPGERNRNGVLFYPHPKKTAVRYVSFLGRLGEEAGYFEVEPV